MCDPETSNVVYFEDGDVMESSELCLLSQIESPSEAKTYVWCLSNAGLFVFLVISYGPDAFRTCALLANEC